MSTGSPVVTSLSPVAIQSFLEVTDFSEVTCCLIQLNCLHLCHQLGTTCHCLFRPFKHRTSSKWWAIVLAKHYPLVDGFQLLAFLLSHSQLELFLAEYMILVCYLACLMVPDSFEKPFVSFFGVQRQFDPSLYCTGHFVIVPLNLTYLHCLQHSFFEHIFNLYNPLNSDVVVLKVSLNCISTILFQLVNISYNL